VLVNVLVDAGTCSAADIHADVEALRMKSPGQGRFAHICQGPHFKRRVIRKPGAVRGVFVGNNHEVAVIVRIPVHDDEIFFTAKQNKVLPVALLLRLCTENTTRLFMIDSAQILHAPGSPKFFHVSESLATV